MRLESSDDFNNLIIEIARPSEAEEIATFLEDYLYCQSPAIHMIAINPSPVEFKERKAFILNNIRRSLKDPLSLIVRKVGSGELVAVRVNRLERL